MKLKTIIILILGGLPLFLYPFVLLANVMGMAGYRSGNEALLPTLLSTIFYLASTAYPLIYLIFAGIAVVKVFKKSGSALGFALVPIVYLIFLVSLLAIWSLAGTETINQRKKTNAPQIGECAGSMLIGNEDGLTTTGCGQIEVGDEVRGELFSISEAQNWDFQASAAYRLTISLKNDKNSCPEIRVFDQSGDIAKGFEFQNVPPLCPKGMITTTFFYFTPSADGRYIIRVFSPRVPGEYRLIVEQK